MDFLIVLSIPLLSLIIGWFFGRNQINPDTNPEYYKGETN